MDAIDGFGLDALQNVGLPETGDLVVTRGGEPHIVTEWGKILTSYLSYAVLITWSWPLFRLILIIFIYRKRILFFRIHNSDLTLGLSG